MRYPTDTSTLLSILLVLLIAKDVLTYDEAKLLLKWSEGSPSTRAELTTILRETGVDAL